MRLKRLAKISFQHSILTRRPAIVVASMGRSGSTLVCRAVRQGMVRARGLHWLGQFGESVVKDDAWNLASKKFARGVVYKTHALAHELPVVAHVKVIFLFGPASAAALSVLACQQRYRTGWIEEHLEHMRANGPFDALGERDILRLEEQIDGWLSLECAPLLALHYEHLWDHAEIISRFAGFPVQLPPRRPRNSRAGMSAETVERFINTYAALDSKIARLPTCCLRGGLD